MPEDPHPTERIAISPEARRRAMRDAILAQCWGCLGSLAFQNGLLLLFLSATGFSRIGVMVCLILPFLFQAVLTVPGAHWADRHGKKRLGMFGLVLTVAGFALIAASPFLGMEWGWLLSIGGILAFSAGWSFMNAGWYALISPIVPEDERGLFFGRLRFSWQLVGIFFVAGCTAFLSKDSPIQVFQIALAVITFALFMRIVYYRRMPELEKPKPRGAALYPVLVSAVRAPGFMSFCAYVFLLMLVTNGGPAIFGLIEKKVIGFGDDLVVWMGNLWMIGAVFGYLLSGKAVDRWGTKPVFVVCHFTYGAILFLFVVRDLAPAPILPYLGALHFLYGCIYAASSIAVSTEMMALIPKEDKSVTTSLCMTFYNGGSAVSGLLAAGLLDLGLFSPHWACRGAALTDYDGVLLLCGLAVTMLVVTLGLVPSVIGRAEHFPKGG